MASAYKSSQSQLLALYKLKFNKNRNNWNLYEDVRKEQRTSPKISSKHSKTYNLSKNFPHLECDTESLSLHYKDLLEEEPATHQELKPAEDPLDLHLEYLTPAQIRQTAEDWLTLQGLPVGREECADRYEEYRNGDESADFVRCAHQVPHSSEIDLTTTKECASARINSLSVLSVRQLARAIQRHHTALTLLLREQALRETLSSRSLLTPPIPFEDYPLHNRDPLGSDYTLCKLPRVLSAGQYADRGRGRGRDRLHQCRAIRIAKGKPYRL